MYIGVSHFPRPFFYRGYVPSHLDHEWKMKDLQQRNFMQCFDREHPVVLIIELN